jgi:hypothetical protein
MINPCLVTDVGGLAELVPHNKVGYISALDKRQIADDILDFYSVKRKKSLLIILRLKSKNLHGITLPKNCWDLYQKHKFILIIKDLHMIGQVFLLCQIMKTNFAQYQLL